ncbi:hypothetical protein HDZ31DRAFT_28424 [Schizophyllum fasciatum]
MPPETATRSHSLRQSFGRFFPKDSDKEKLAKTKTKEKDISKDWSDVRDAAKDVPKDFGAKEFGAIDSLTAKQAKQARRSTLGARPSGGRPSLGELAQDKTVTRRRVSSGQSRAMSVDEGSPAKPHAPAPPTHTAPPPTTASSSTSTDPPLKRATSLRPKPAASALPKYRPRSGLFDPARVPRLALDAKGSPRKPKVSREPPSTDEDEKLQETSTSSSCADGRPRPALEVNLTGAIHVSGSPKGKSKAPAPAAVVAAAGGAKATPTRPAKLHKAASPAPKPSPARQGSASPGPKPSAPSPGPKAPAARPGSAASNTSTRAPVTPAAAAKAAATRTESPLARKSRPSPAPAPAPPAPPPKARQDTGNMSDISETSEDENSEDEDDVAALLAPVASPSAPTPAMPRVYRTRKTSKVGSGAKPSPQTPSRARRVSAGLGKRRSFLAPSTPAHRKRSAGSLRTPKSGEKAAPRGSILTWEELAQSHTLDEDDMAAMLADMPAPFRASIASPPGSPSLSPVTLDTPLPPESPALSTMGLTPGTPGGGYGSISQVLLPDVTPSPAPFAASAARYDEAARSPPARDGASTTLLRLQLASLENTARERLQRLQELEEELHGVKAARRAEAGELGAQLEALEAELRRAMDSRERGEEERHQYVMALEAQAVRAEQDARARAAEAAKRAKAEQGSAVEKARALWQVGRVADAACARWASVREMAEGDLGDVKSDLELLTTLLGQLDGERARLQCALRR